MDLQNNYLQSCKILYMSFMTFFSLERVFHEAYTLMELSVESFAFHFLEELLKLNEP